MVVPFICIYRFYVGVESRLILCMLILVSLTGKKERENIGYKRKL